MFQWSGLNLSQALGEVPPSVPTDPVSTCRKNRQRATCQPPRLPDPADLQVWDANRDPASGDTPRHGFYAPGVHAALLGGEFDGVGGVGLPEQFQEALVCAGPLGAPAPGGMPPS